MANTKSILNVAVVICNGGGDAQCGQKGASKFFLSYADIIYDEP